MPHKTKVPIEKMVKACQNYLQGKSSFQQIAETLGVDRTTIRCWVRRYKTEDVDGLVPQKHKRIYSPDLKLQAVLEYLQGTTSLAQICEKYKIKEKCQLRHWIKQYNSHEEFKPMSGGSRMTKRRNTTQDERKEIVQYCLAHEMNYGETAKHYQVSYSQVYQWVKKYKEMGDAGLEVRRGHTITNACNANLML